MIHLFFSSIVLAKDAETGEWQLTEVTTNKGRFLLGADANAKLEQEVIDKLALHVRDQVTEEISSFLELELELEEEQNAKDEEQC